VHSYPALHTCRPVFTLRAVILLPPRMPQKIKKTDAKPESVRPLARALTRGVTRFVQP
jgi:hypothetical protein